MNNKVIKLSVALSTLIFISPTIVLGADNLIQNGSFEDYSIDSDHGKWKEVTFTNWTGTGEVWKR